MGFGSTAKKLQKVTEMADKLYERFEEVREQVKDLTDSVEETNERVATLEGELAEQRALVERLADAQGVDVEAVVAEAGSGERDTADASDVAEAGDGND